MADITSESVADIKSECLVDLLRNTQLPRRMIAATAGNTARAAPGTVIQSFAFGRPEYQSNG
jgi:hypothetical protein